MLTENRGKIWRALSSRLFGGRPATCDREDRIEIGHALTYSATQLLSSLQLFDGDAKTLPTLLMPGKRIN